MMRPVRQRRPRRGADFVLPDVPMLDSPNWSDDDDDSGSNRATPQAMAQAQAQAQAAAAVAAARAMNAQMMYSPANLPPPANPYFSPVNVQRVAGPVQHAPMMMNGMPYNSPGAPRMSPALEQQQQQQKMFVPGANRVRQERRDRCANSADPETNFRNRVEARRGDGAGGRGRRTTAPAAATSAMDDAHSADGASGEDQRGEDIEEAYEGESEETNAGGRRSPTQVGMGSFANSTIASHAHFAGGSLFVAHQRNDDDDEEDDDDDIGMSLSSSSNGRPFSDDGCGSDVEASPTNRDKESRRARRHDDTDSVIAPSYFNYMSNATRSKANTNTANNNATNHHRNSNSSSNNNYDGVKKGEQRKPSLFAMSTAGGASSPAKSTMEGITSAAPSVFNGYLMGNGADDESPNNRLRPETSTMFVGPSHVPLDRSVGPTNYHYGGGQLHASTNAGNTTAGPSEANTAGPTNHTPLMDRHGTFLMATEDANRNPGASTAAAARPSPVGTVGVYPKMSGDGGSSPLHLLSLSPLHHNGADRSAARRSPARNVTPTRQHRQDPRPSIAGQYDEVPLDTESVVAMPAVDRSGSRHGSRSSCSGDESEEERYEQLQRSRFFHSLNSRITLRRALEMEGSRVGTYASNLTWQGVAATESSTADDDVVLFGAHPAAAQNARGTSASVSASSTTANPYPDRHNFRGRIATRQGQPQPVQPLSRFPPTSITATAPPATTAPGKKNAASSEAGADNAARQSPSSGAGRRRSGPDALAFSLDANLLSHAAAGVAKQTSTLSAGATGMLGGLESDEYGLMYWASSPDGPRRVSLLSEKEVKDTRKSSATASTTAQSKATTNATNATGAGVAGGVRASDGPPLPQRRTPQPSPGTVKSSVMPISLQPAQIATARRPTSTASNYYYTGSVTIVSPSAATKSTGSSPYYSIAGTPQERSTAPSVIPSNATSPSGMPPASSSAPVIPTPAHEARRVSGDSGDAATQWTPNDDVYYFHAGGYGSMTGKMGGNSPSIASHSRRPPSFSGYRNDDYFLVNSFRSSTAPPLPRSERENSGGPSSNHYYGVAAADTDALLPMPSVSADGALHRRPSNPRSAPLLATPVTHQKRLSTGETTRSGRDKPKHFASVPPSFEGVPVVAHAPPIPTKTSSGISAEVVPGLEDYGFPTELDTASNIGGYYGLDSDSDSDTFLPPVVAERRTLAPTAPSSAPPRHTTPSIEPRRSGDSAAFAAADAQTTPSGTTGRHAHRRQRVSSSASAEDYVQVRRRSSRETPRASPSPQEMRTAGTRELHVEEQQVGRPSRSRASSTSSSKAKHSSKGAGKSARGVKQATPPVVPPSAPAFTALHSTEHAARTERSASSRPERSSPSTRYNPRAASVTKN